MRVPKKMLRGARIRAASDVLSEGMAQVMWRHVGRYPGTLGDPHHQLT